MRWGAAWTGAPRASPAPPATLPSCSRLADVSPPFPSSSRQHTPRPTLSTQPSAQAVGQTNSCFGPIHGMPPTHPSTRTLTLTSSRGPGRLPAYRPGGGQHRPVKRSRMFTQTLTPSPPSRSSKKGPGRLPAHRPGGGQHRPQRGAAAQPGARVRGAAQAGTWRGEGVACVCACVRVRVCVCGKEG